jgi:integrase
MSVYKPKKSPHWHIDFQVKGCRVHKSTGQGNKAAAKQEERSIRVAIADGSYFKKREDMSVDDAVGLYWRSHGQYARSAADLRGKLARLVAGLGPTMLSGLTTDVLRGYIGERLRGGQRGRKGRRPIGSATVNRELAALRAVLRYVAETAGVAPGRALPWRKLLLKEPAQRARWLGEAEQERLLLELGEDLRRMVLFGLATGARLGTLLRLEWRDVDFRARQIVLRDVKSTRPGLVHRIPLTEGVAALLREAEGQHPSRVFTYLCRRRGVRRRPGQRYPFTATNWRREWARALKAAGVPDLRFHDLRHTAASRLVHASGNLILAKELLGHAAIGTTMRYVHAREGDLRAAMETVSRNSPETRTGREGNPAGSDSEIKHLIGGRQR